MLSNPSTAIDFYKADHRRQYPEGTTEVYSNLTPRSAKLAPFTVEGEHQVVFFGLQYFIKHFLIDDWNENFFNQPLNRVMDFYRERMDASIGKGAIPIEHIKELWELGHLPIEIKALEEGTRVPMGVPMLTIKNTKPEFFWITNYLETALSSYLWKPTTVATIADRYRAIIKNYTLKTDSPISLIDYQGHDFSMRGMSGYADAAVSGAGHLTSFSGTDTVPAIDMVQQYYGADATAGASVPATEHSVMCMGMEDGELETFRRLIEDLYPKGIVSIVSDTWDFWKVITEFLPHLKDKILSRDGKVVIRPDSGDPVKIICGDPDAKKGTPEYKGAIQCLWETFGGTVTDKKYKLLDSHIGLIYGDSITVERCEKILGILEKKGFAAGNVVFGIGSYTYQYITRDSFGMAVKATSGVVNGERRVISKNPATDDGTKKSAAGLLRVEKSGEGELVLFQEQSELQEQQGLLTPVFKDGKLLRETTLGKIREMLRAD